MEPGSGSPTTVKAGSEVFASLPDPFMEGSETQATPVRGTCCNWTAQLKSKRLGTIPYRGFAWFVTQYFSRGLG
jgi:hypothetical protein